MFTRKQLNVYAAQAFIINHGLMQAMGNPKINKK
jgi:hypothetical protein